MPLKQTGHANNGLSSFRVVPRVSQRLNLVVGEEG
jgi:hypothetical protein